MASIKGIILAGGLGTRLRPLTNITNKHLLPVYDKPMIYYPMQTLLNAGISDLHIVTGGPYAGDFLRLLGNGKDFGLKHIHYSYQEGEGGIADALRLTEFLCEGSKVVVMLGDNVIEKNIVKAVREFESQDKGAKIFLKEVANPSDYGVAELDGDRVIGIEEKPANPKTNLAVIGVYMYDSRVYDIVRTLKPSARGELEITDVNNVYINEGSMTYELLDGWWADAGGGLDSLHKISALVAETGANKMD